MGFWRVGERVCVFGGWIVQSHPFAVCVCVNLWVSRAFIWGGGARGATLIHVSLSLVLSLAGGTDPPPLSKDGLGLLG